jgi:hypothetical protein
MQTATATASVRTTLRHFVTEETTEADLETDLTAEEATRRIVRSLGLATAGTDGPQHYELYVRHHDGSSEALRPTIRIGDAVQDGDELAPLPEVIPGAPAEDQPQ